jgi:hypothetical protein
VLSVCIIRACRNQNTRDEKEQVMFLIYCLEHASRLADEQRECTAYADAGEVHVACSLISSLQLLRAARGGRTQFVLLPGDICCRGLTTGIRASSGDASSAAAALEALLPCSTLHVCRSVVVLLSAAAAVVQAWAR